MRSCSVLEGLVFEGAIFTNLSHDHLDYHKTFAEYRDTKKILFDNLTKKAFALTNIDDKNGLVMLQNTKARKCTYALKTYADYRAQILENQFDGQLLKINDSEFWSKLIGHFNAYNMLAIYATAELLGLEKFETLRLLSGLENVDGRFQYYISKEKITAIVDYAHTPDALKNVLDTINTLRTGNENVITVVGCGGDRDRSKRPVMGHIASEMSNKAIFTSDNPRSEEPAVIIEEMVGGVEPQNTKKILSIENREQAIKTACQLALANDIILVAGKGHETYQETNGKRIDFDDFKIIKMVSYTVNFLIGLVAFSGNEYGILRSGNSDAQVNSFFTVRFNDKSFSRKPIFNFRKFKFTGQIVFHACPDFCYDRFRVFRPGIIRRDHHKIAYSACDFSHLGTLRLIPVTAASENTNQSPGNNFF